MKIKFGKICVLVIVGMLVTIMLATPAAAPPRRQRWSTTGNNVASSARLGTRNDEPLRFITNGEGRMIITSDGNVGIGVINPNEKLDVDGNIHASGSFISGSTTTYGDGYIALSSGTNLSIGSDTIFVDNANNRVGIGTNTPAAKLDIVANKGFFTGYGWRRGIQLDRGNAIFWNETRSNHFFMVHGSDTPVGDMYAGLVATIDGTTDPHYAYKIYGKSREGEPTIGTIRFFNDVLVGGNIGIGTISPDDELHVVGTAQIQDKSSSVGLRLETDYLWNVIPNSIVNFDLIENSGDVSTKLRFSSYSGTTVFDELSLEDDLVVDGNVETSSTSGYYFGDPNTDGTWRIIRLSRHLAFQRFESGSWVTKDMITA
jgi:hypothetical protein